MLKPEIPAAPHKDWQRERKQQPDDEDPSNDITAGEPSRISLMQKEQNHERGK
jgi:hypothetical protein